ncbi:hypothetical protein ACLOJK_007843 [Asimina triloba]
MDVDGGDGGCCGWLAHVMLVGVRHCWPLDLDWRVLATVSGALAIARSRIWERGAGRCCRWGCCGVDGDAEGACSLGRRARSSGRVGIATVKGAGSGGTSLDRAVEDACRRVAVDRRRG